MNVSVKVKLSHDYLFDIPQTWLLIRLVGDGLDKLIYEEATSPHINNLDAIFATFDEIWATTGIKEDSEFGRDIVTQITNQFHEIAQSIDDGN